MILIVMRNSDFGMRNENPEQQKAEQQKAEKSENQIVRAPELPKRRNSRKIIREKMKISQPLLL